MGFVLLVWLCHCEQWLFFKYLHYFPASDGVSLSVCLCHCKQWPLLKHLHYFPASYDASSFVRLCHWAQVLYLNISIIFQWNTGLICHTGSVVVNRGQCSNICIIIQWTTSLVCQLALNCCWAQVLLFKHLHYFSMRHRVSCHLGSVVANRGQCSNICIRNRFSFSSRNN